jgi:hypothetical protein
MLCVSPFHGVKVNKTSLVGIITAVYGLLILIGAIAECPAKHASVSVSLFMVLVGICFYALGKELKR